MNIAINIFLLLSTFTFLLGAIINALNITNDKKIDKIHVDYIRVSLIFAVIGLILYIINQQTK